MNYQTTIKTQGKKFKTLADILPTNGKLKILFIAKTPAPKSVEIGHYFQGQQGKMFWNKLVEYNILSIRPNTFEDENLLNHGYGITDIVKEPRDFGNEPTREEYQNGLKRIEDIIRKYKADIIVFVYKRVLDNILKLGYGLKTKSEYGLNNDLQKLFRTKVFVFPMPGTRCTRDQAKIAMMELSKLVKSSR